MRGAGEQTDSERQSSGEWQQGLGVSVEGCKVGDCLSATRSAVATGSRYWVRLGEHSLSQLDWTEQIRHSGFSVTYPGYLGASTSHEHDLRLLRLRLPVRITSSVRPLPLPNDCATAGTECHVSGWGITNHPWSKGPGARGQGSGWVQVWDAGQEVTS